MGLNQIELKGDCMWDFLFDYGSLALHENVCFSKIVILKICKQIDSKCYFKVTFLNFKFNFLVLYILEYSKDHHLKISLKNQACHNTY